VTEQAGASLPAEIAFDERGLAPAIVQDSSTKDVLMLAWVDAEAIRRTLESGTTWFWSRSRREYWNKGATSGNTQKVVEVRYDCDARRARRPRMPHG
jgi:phosphoribosyl-AMP cyclohydrolase